MVALLTILRVTMAVTGLALVALAVWVDRSRDGPALSPFVFLVAVVGLFALADGLSAGSLTALSLVWLVAYLAIPTAFTWFVVEYYGLPHLASWGRRAAFVAPVALGAVGGAALVLSPSAAGAMAGGSTGGDQTLALALAGFAEQTGLYYAGGVMLAGVGLLVRTVRRYEHLDSRLAAVLSFVCIWPWLAYFTTPGLASMASLPTLVGLTTAGYLLSAGAAGFAVTRGGLFAAAPAAGTLGPETVLAELEDPVVVVDHAERVVRLNRVAEQTFETDAAAATGRSLAAVVGVGLDTLSTPDATELAVAGGTRRFEATVSPVTDRLDRSPGRAVVLRDVTTDRVRAQRLAVLNRVVRHNLRNGMTSIIGRAEVIAREEDDEHGTLAEAIVDSADDLVELGQRAREIEEMMGHSPADDARVDLADLAGDVVERHRETYPDASLTVDVDEHSHAAADGRIVSSILDNLVENALEHNDAPTPVVTVSARREGEAVRVSVTDNGPGLPEHERAVIEAGEESPLEHGSGLGLWAVHWGVRRVGGELSFSDQTPEGTVVTVRLPAADSPTAATPASAVPGDD